MKKLQPIDEAGRATAHERYGPVDKKSKHGHSQMHRNMADKFDTGPQVSPAVKPSMDVGGRR